MNEMNLLEEFRAVVAPPDDAMLARARAQMLDGTAASGRRPARAPRLPGSWPRLALTGLAATATAVVVAVAFAAQGGVGPSGPGPANPAAKELAYQAAAAAQAQPTVHPGQWVYRLEQTANAGAHAPEGKFQVWTTADSTKAAYLSQGKVAFIPCGKPLGSSDGGCQSVGQPVIMTADGGQVTATSGETGTIPVSYAHLSSLPSNPVALDNYLASLPLRGWGPAPLREFQVIEELIATYVMPPALTAELYRALGNISGITIDRHAVDVAGRTGIGFQAGLPRAMGGGIDQLIIHPKTYSLMGQQLIAAGHVVSGTAILAAALVSGPGILP
jgi:hypothetical protein